MKNNRILYLNDSQALLRIQLEIEIVNIKSKTYLKYHSEILNENESKVILVPEGCAHGFQTLAKDCHLMYFHSESYSLEYERSINVFDPLINIKWPLDKFVISDKDKKIKYLKS